MRAWLGVLVLTMGFAWPGAEQRLVGELTRASTPRDKRDALRLLGGLADLDPAVVLPFTRDADPGVRAEAYRLLDVAVEDPALEVRLVRPRLDDPEPQVRAAAAHTAETRALIARLDDDALEVRIAAVHALAGRATPALLALSEAALPELRAAVVDALAHGEVTPDVERVLQRALDDRDLDVVLAALRGYARHAELRLPASVHTLANGVHAQLARAARALLEPRCWQDPLWLTVLERTTREDPIDALEALLPAGEARATEPLRAWLAHAPTAIAPRIEALIARSLQTSTVGDKRAEPVANGPQNGERK
ncbi:MAG TPA: hypothetical protein VFX59_25200 [Polyangiales bacterium]|nr:hypothetical protein [Polyangiales bacterium]